MRCLFLFYLKNNIFLLLQIPPTYPLTPIELRLPELDGKTSKMYRYCYCTCCCCCCCFGCCSCSRRSSTSTAGTASAAALLWLPVSFFVSLCSLRKTSRYAFVFLVLLGYWFVLHCCCCCCCCCCCMQRRPHLSRRALCASLE